MENNYIRLTKHITDENGEDVIVCKFAGTAKCQEIHNEKKCRNCKMISEFITQLAIFEDVYLSESEVYNE